MKKNVNQLLLVLLFPLMGIHFFSCVPKSEPCPEPPETITVDISSYLKTKIPYTGYDTLTFIRKSIGDTHVFIGQGIKRSYDILRIPSGDPECQAMKGDAKTENLSYIFTSGTFTSPIKLGLYYYQYPGEPYFYISFNDQYYERNSVILGKPYLYDSLEIGGRMYYNLDQISDESYPSTKQYYILYNSTFGILKFRFKSGEEWERLTKP